MDMRRLLAAGLLALIGATGTSFAADLSATLPTTKAPIPASTINWSGFYVGVNAGGDWYGGKGFAGGGNVQSLFPASNIINVPSTFDRTSAGFTAGGLAGYNYQIGSFVLGAETDFNYIDSRSDNHGALTEFCCGDVSEMYGHGSTSQLDWFGTARARLGFLPTARLLIYGTGGLAYGEVEGTLEHHNVFSGIATSRYWQGSDSDVKVGWTLGAGAECALTSAISIRAEYVYPDLGKSSVTANYVGLFPATAPDAQVYYTSSHDNKFNVARAAIAYKF
jgi:outer membrane immunogenic protein